MTGMASTASAMDLNSDSNRMVLLEVTGSSHQNIIRSSVYSLTVPYNRLSKTMQSIHRRGGKITNVTVLSAGSARSAQSATPQELPSTLAVATAPATSVVDAAVDAAPVAPSAPAVKASAERAPVASTPAGFSTAKNDAKGTSRPKSKRKR